jgi:hypothetical protein
MRRLGALLGPEHEGSSVQLTKQFRLLAPLNATNGAGVASCSLNFRLAENEDDVLDLIARWEGEYRRACRTHRHFSFDEGSRGFLAALEAIRIHSNIRRGVALIGPGFARAMLAMGGTSPRLMPLAPRCTLPGCAREQS